MNKILFWFLGLYFLSAAPTAQAQLKSEAQQLVDQYVQAFKSDDEPRMNEVFDRITADPAAHDFIRENHPREYALINLRHILRRIDEMERRYGNSLRKKQVIKISPDTLVVTSHVGYTSGNLRGSHDNRTITNAFSNQKRTPNQFRNTLANHRVQRTNGDTVRAYSNQDHVRSQSNQQRLRSRR